MLRVREDGLQELGVVGAVHVDGDRRLELEVLAPAGDAAAGLADVEGLGVVRLELRVVGLGQRGSPNVPPAGTFHLTCSQAFSRYRERLAHRRW